MDGVVAAKWADYIDESDHENAKGTLLKRSQKE